jgi:hypothetical protein
VRQRRPEGVRMPRPAAALRHEMVLIKTEGATSFVAPRKDGIEQLASPKPRSEVAGIELGATG